MTLQTWELALIIGCGTLALLMCAYSVYILMRRRRSTKPLTKVIVEMKEGRDTRGSMTSTATKESAVAGTTKEKPTSKKTSETTETATAKSKGETSADVIAVKIQPNNNAVTCPGGGKACVGSRKEGVKTIPQPNQLPAPKIRRDSAPSRISSGHRSAPRV